MGDWGGEERKKRKKKIKEQRHLKSVQPKIGKEKQKKIEIHGKQEKKRWQEKFKHIRSLLRQIRELSVAIKRISDWAKNLQLGAISMSCT